MFCRSAACERHRARNTFLFCNELHAGTHAPCVEPKRQLLELNSPASHDMCANELIRAINGIKPPVPNVYTLC